MATVMTSLENIFDLPVWEHPSDYAGYSPDGEYVILSRHRDSSIRENSNYETALKLLETVESVTCAEQNIDSGEEPFVSDFRASHFAVGWVEHIIVRADSPIAVLKEAYDILAALENYPILDDEDVSSREFEQACTDYERMPMQERIDLCNRYDESIFAARAESLCDFIDRAEQAANYILEHVDGC